MLFLRILLWAVLAAIVLAFSYNNWQWITLKLWDGLQLDTKVPVLVIGSFLLGFLPMWIAGRFARWRLTRRIASLESSLEREQKRNAPPPPSPAVAAESTADNRPRPVEPGDGGLRPV